MANLYHVSCYRSWWRRFVRWVNEETGVPRFVYEGRPDVGDGDGIVDVDRFLRVQTFRCQSCGHVIHVDTDWVDAKGGWLGGAVDRETRED